MFPKPSSCNCNSTCGKVINDEFWKISLLLKTEGIIAYMFGHHGHLKFCSMYPYKSWSLCLATFKIASCDLHTMDGMSSTQVHIHQYQHHCPPQRHRVCHQVTSERQIHVNYCRSINLSPFDPAGDGTGVRQGLCSPSWMCMGVMWRSNCTKRSIS